jgi:hypothetical protein
VGSILAVFVGGGLRVGVGAGDTRVQVARHAFFLKRPRCRLSADFRHLSG